MPYTYMFSSKQERFEKRPLCFTGFMSIICSWNWIKSLKPPIIHSYWRTFDWFLLHPSQLHSIKSIISYDCFNTEEVWWKRLLKFRSIDINRYFASKMWFLVPYFDCRHLACIVLWLFINGKKSMLPCTEMLPFRRK